MNRNDPQIDALLGKAADFSGKDRSKIDAMIADNPQISAMLSKMKQSDIEKLSAILSDKSMAQQLLSSPKAQQILRSLRNK